MGFALAGALSLSGTRAMEPDLISLQLQQPSQFLVFSLNPSSIPSTGPEFTSMPSKEFSEKSIAAPSMVTEPEPYRLDATQFKDRGEVQIIVHGPGFQDGASSVGNTLYAPPSAMPAP